MQENNLNNSSLGRLIDVSPSTVKFWREGKWPEMPKIEKIAEALKTTPSYLVYGVEENKAYKIQESGSKQLQEPLGQYGITKDELVEFFKWKAEKAIKEAETATKQVERLKSTEVDAK